jgi:hypothetical protein
VQIGSDKMIEREKTEFMAIFSMIPEILTVGNCSES